MERSGHRHHKPLPEIFEPRVDEVSNECWRWPGYQHPETGYSFIRTNYKLHRVHRLAYERRFGPVPKGIDLHHLCFHRWCWNPLHLLPVNRKEHSPEGLVNQYVGRTHCSKGHNYKEDGYSYTNPQGKTCRRCRACNKESRGALAGR